MTQIRKFNARLDQQIVLWLARQEKFRAEESHVEGRRVLMVTTTSPPRDQGE